MPCIALVVCIVKNIGWKSVKGFFKLPFIRFIQLKGLKCCERSYCKYLLAQTSGVCSVSPQA